MTKKTILTFSLILFAVSLHAQNISRLYKKCLPAIVKISILRYDGTASEGTGFFIDEKTIVTCYHIADNVKTMDIETSDGKKFKVDSIVASNRATDLIKLTVKEKNKAWLKLSDKLPEVGESALLIGNPGDYDFSITNGIVSAIRMKNSVQVIQTTAPSSSGNSGSPLLNRKGKVIGVMSYVKFIGQNLNFAATSLNVINMKDDNTIQQLLPLATMATKLEMDSIYNVANFYFKSKDYQNALATILPITKFADTTQAIEFTELIANCHFFLQDYPKAVQYYDALIKKLFQIKKHTPDDVFTYAKALHNASMCYFILDDKESAIDVIAKSLEVCRNGLENTTIEIESETPKEKKEILEKEMNKIRKEQFTLLIQQIYVSDATYKFSLNRTFEGCLSWKLAKQYGYKKEDFGYDEICK